MGSVVVSLDAEIGWGFHHYDRPPAHRVENGRRGWRRTLALLEEFDVPATWAVVGHLMLESCDGEHADHPAAPDWFERERTTWNDRPELRFAPDLVRDVVESDVDHELASHSFSHVLFGRPETTRAIADAELERAREIASEWDLTFETFIYPRNDIGHRDALADHGFRTYRGRSPTPGGVKGLVNTAVRDNSLLVQPRIDEYGLVNVPASLFLFGFEGRARTVAESVWRDPMVVQARRAVDEAASSDGICHLWLHPNNLVDERDDERMRAILQHVARRRADSDLVVETMGEVGRRVTTPSIQGNGEVVTSTV